MIVSGIDELGPSGTTPAYERQTLPGGSHAHTLPSMSRIETPPSPIATSMSKPLVIVKSRSMGAGPQLGPAAGTHHSFRKSRLFP